MKELVLVLVQRLKRKEMKWNGMKELVLVLVNENERRKVNEGKLIQIVSLCSYLKKVTIPSLRSNLKK